MRWVRTATKKSYPFLRSVGMPPSPPRRNVATDIRARVRTATITRQEQRFRICASEHDASPLCDGPFVSAFVPPPTWSYDEQSTHSSYHVRCGFGWRTTQQLRATLRRSTRYGENGGVTRLRQKYEQGGNRDTRGGPAELANAE